MTKMLRKFDRLVRMRTSRKKAKVKASLYRRESQRSKLFKRSFPVLEYFAEGEYYLNYKNIPHVHPADNIPVASEFKPFFKAPLAFFIP